MATAVDEGVYCSRSTTFQPASSNHWSIFILAFSSGVISVNSDNTQLSEVANLLNLWQTAASNLMDFYDCENNCATRRELGKTIVGLNQVLISSHMYRLTEYLDNKIIAMHF